MREGRNFMQGFNPQTFDEFMGAFFGPHSGHIRMVAGYWDMAASFVVNGAVDAKMFDDANAEHWGVYTKFEPYLPQFREALINPRFLKNLEDLCLAVPDGRQRVVAMRERMKKIAAMRAAAAAKPAA